MGEEEGKKVYTRSLSLSLTAQLTLSLLHQINLTIRHSATSEDDITLKLKLTTPFSKVYTVRCSLCPLLSLLSRSLGLVSLRTAWYSPAQPSFPPSPLTAHSSQLTAPPTSTRLSRRQLTALHISPQAVAKQKGIASNSFKLLFDGERLNPEASQSATTTSGLGLDPAVLS